VADARGERGGGGGDGAGSEGVQVRQSEGLLERERPKGRL